MSRHVLVRVALTVVLLAALLPILYLVSLSVRPPDDVLNSSLWPREWTTANFTSVFHTIELGTMLQNSWISAVGAALLAVAIATPAAYFTARRVAGERLLTALLAAYCAPPIVAIIPLFFLLRSLGLTNNVVGLILVNGIASVPVAAWLLDGFVRRIPVEIDEAAVIDGLSVGAAFRRAVLPLLWPGIVAALLVVFFLSYNDFLFAVYLAVTKESQTLTVGLSLFQGDRNVQFGQQAAAGLLGILPVYALALAAQRYLVGGLATGATK
ncbi:binding-protein-dependent transport system inner membrane protein [Mycolicibacterium phlei]|uniref:ABC transporter permease n=1 Tax=Mycolicibacterium phlei DSM 43239 = CCUG 21000 TaxID=1226750 RepID=A0A5N5UZL3_MYCPH|nr:carbohydrate ABC transporter permease [Mycolicibacterium phlei]VEG10155.1 binding-protein-dependent transport system inner membrane protein [Mycobacteroides chelonae]AMO62050.1 Trehalose transport system permease protein SugB [Mycolicibacterium phlei]EID14210.1 ABC transporter permease [Mycolicibacterium phlei RIVM601174]KAB7753670.1 ABC transporter permease [Mycolicibacterium phlei DSM 43239 = CCUG 21000]KXW63157.1 ABC transporter permease [Mycolicibacterium phlei DSM 43070]